MTSTTPPLKAPWRRWVIILAVAVLLTLFFATKDSLGQRAMGVQIRWGKNLWWKAMEWYAWALFSPFIFLLCRRLDFRRSRWRTIAAQLAWAVIFSLLHGCVVTAGAWLEAQVLHTGLSLGRLFEIVLSSYFHEDVLTYAGIVSVWYALDYYQQFQERERQAAELEQHLAKARLQALKMQLQPHFLFNTLNGIAALNYEDPRAANRMLARLSELLRMTLEDDDAPEVSLRQELDFNRRYLELEQIRLGDRLTVTLEIAPETLDAGVPNLLLQPLVENAIKHGLSELRAGGQIQIRSAKEEDRLVLSVSDNGTGLAAESLKELELGVGLGSTCERLARMYPERHELAVRKLREGGTEVRVVLPFRLNAAPA